MTSRFLMIVAMVVALLALPPATAAKDPASVSLDCTSNGLLPSGPPLRLGQIDVVSADGQARTLFVPGPCSAPGF